jgi:hypothetical protein
MTQEETNKAVKNYADAMERGWMMCPVMVSDRFWLGLDPRNPEACCSNGHAALGSDEYRNADDWFGFRATIDDIKVEYTNKENNSTMPIRLASVIDILVGDGWTTPQIIAWLRSHQDD